MENKKFREVFGTYISDLRKKKRYSLEQVCEGLCTAQQLSKFERGEKTVSKLLQDALLERLGIGAEDYEHYLNAKDYDHWKMRQRILYHIHRRNTAEARALLNEYYSQHVEEIANSKKVSDRLEYQFYLSMQAQIRTQEGADRNELHTLLETALGLTVPRLWKNPLSEKVLSFKEINLALETEQYREGEAKAGHYREILSYIEISGADALGMAKIYPKAVYLLCRCYSIQDGTARDSASEGNRIQRGGNQDNISEEILLGYCNRAVEILRDGNRMYYLWELLGLRAFYLERAIEQATENLEGKPPGELTLLYRENAAWKKTLETVYDRYKVPRETFSYCYLYLEKGIFCTNDVIRIRREMLGMNRRDLCEGICDKKTLERLENRKHTPHRQITEELFERLGLAGTLLRTSLISESQETRRLMSRMRWYQNNHEPEKADATFSQLESLVPTEITWNRQTLMRQEANIQNRLEEMSDQAYCMRIQEALELTLPFQAFLRDGEKYLTHEEQACIQNMMRKMDSNSEKFQICMERFEEMYRPAAEGELLGNISMSYALVMGYVASELGNRGKYDKSDWYTERMIEEDLYSRRLQSIANCLYNRWWNDTQRKERGIPTDREWDDLDELTNCIWLSRLNKRTHQEAFYKEKRKQLTQQN